MAALLRLLIYKIDNTTFGSDVPALPQWTGPPHMIVQVQAILFASLALSLLSAFLAMLGKQWLNRYQSTGMRGLVIERSHNRQRKLGGMLAWYFDHVMESLPLMLQAALLLLGCALTRYLWEINPAVASVVLSFTSIGAAFYIFIVIAGTASDSCPYQTPPAQILRYTRHRLLPILHSAYTAVAVFASSNFSRVFHTSMCFQLLPGWWLFVEQPWCSTYNFAHTFFILLLLPIAPLHDVYRLGQAVLRFLLFFSRKAYRQLAGRHRTAYRSFIATSTPRTLGPDQQSIRLDMWCISWILRASLDKDVHLSAFKYLTSMPALARFDPSLIAGCFNAFIQCVNISDGKAVVTQGLEQLAKVSANGFFRILHHFAIMDPTSTALVDFQQRYNEVFPSEVDFTGLPFDSTMTKIHALASRFGNPRDIWWHRYGMSIQEYVLSARRLVQVAQEGYQQTQHRKVSRWILRSALHILSLGPVSPPSIVADCLTIIALDLGCDVPNTVISDERCV